MCCEVTPYRNSNSMRLTYLNCDSGSEQLETCFLTYCRTNHIYVQASAPYKHQQNFIECFVGAIKNGVRVALLYNKAPFYLCYHAIVYYIHTYNQTPRRNDTRSKDECFYGKKSDVSTAVPFDANGFAHRPKEIRKDKVYSQRAEQCRFIGYADDVNWTNSPQITGKVSDTFLSFLIINGGLTTMIVLSLFVEFDKIDATKSSFCRFLSKLTKTLLYGST